ncbi:MAG: YqgE/AlgH family protein [Bacteroidota bacterium]
MKNKKDNFFNIKQKNKKLKVGSILISEPMLEDYYFRRAVILILDCDDNGAMGVVLNKPIFIDINEVISDLSSKPFPLFSGGPVEIDRVFFLHQLSNVISESELIIDEVFWSGKQDDLAKYLGTPDFDDSKIKAFIGYSGWESGQLEKEIEDGRWVIVDGDRKAIFQEDFNSLWTNMVQSLGEDYHVWLNFPSNPLLN